VKILQISASDIAGGAERVAFNLCKEYQVGGHESLLAVGHKYSSDNSVVEIQNDAHRSAWARFCKKAGGRVWGLPFSSAAKKKLEKAFEHIGEPDRFNRIEKGYEDFNYPGIWHLLEEIKMKPDIIHCHNLHGGYFDLNALSVLSKQVPLLITMHDAWLLSGHCAHSFDCERWKTGCGSCPDLTIYPSVEKDNTHANWEKKKAIFKNGRVYISAPCNWLIDKAGRSVFNEYFAGKRTVNNGIDTTRFNDKDKAVAKKNLGIGDDTFVMLFAGNLLKNNIWKDYNTLFKTLGILAQKAERRKLLFIALGTDNKGGDIFPGELEGIEKLFVPRIDDVSKVAEYYKASDVYMHPAFVDTFPNVVLEAMACGTPVVATGICGIPEQVKSLECSAKASNMKGWRKEEATGILVPPKSPEAMSEAILTLMKDSALRTLMGSNAAKHTAANFDLKQQAGNYLRWYKEIIEAEKAR